MRCGALGMTPLIIVYSLTTLNHVTRDWCLCCHREHGRHYDLYLRARHTEGGGPVPKKGKVIEQLFNMVTRQVQVRYSILVHN